MCVVGFLVYVCTQPYEYTYLLLNRSGKPLCAIFSCRPQCHKPCPHACALYTAWSGAQLKKITRKINSAGVSIAPRHRGRSPCKSRPSLPPNHREHLERPLAILAGGGDDTPEVCYLHDACDSMHVVA